MEGQDGQDRVGMDRARGMWTVRVRVHEGGSVGREARANYTGY